MVNVPLIAAALPDGAAALAGEPPELGAAADTLGLVVAAPGPHAPATRASAMTNGANLRSFIIWCLSSSTGVSSPVHVSAGGPAGVETIGRLRWRAVCSCESWRSAPYRTARRRSADDEPRLQSPMFRFRGLAAVDDAEQQTDRLLALATNWLVDGGQRWIRVSGDVDVVEADNADVARNGQPKRPDGAHRADRHRVAHGEDRRGTQARLPRPLECGNPAGDTGRSDDDPVERQVDASGFERRPVATEAATRDAGRLDLRLRLRRFDADDDEIAVSKVEEVLRR